MINELLTKCNDQKATDVDSSSTDVDARIYICTHSSMITRVNI